MNSSTNDHNLCVDGVITINGGNFSKVDVDGVITITTAVNCETCDIDGVATFKDDVCVKSDGNIDGVATFKGGLDLNGDFALGGVVKVDQNLKATGRTNIKGVLTIKGDAECEQIIVDGCITVNGSINAEELEISYGLGSKAKEVLGTSVKIGGQANSGIHKISNKVLNLIGVSKEFTANLIECDDLLLDCATVKNVNVQKAVIGPHVKIDELIYSKSAQIDPNACIKKIIGPNHQ